MTTKYFGFTTYGSGVQADVTASNGVYVAAGILVGSTDNYGLTGSGDNMSFDIDGSVVGDLGGISLAAGTSTMIVVGETGVIKSDFQSGKAITLAANSGYIENHGLIKAYTVMEISGDSSISLTNDGRLFGYHAGIHFDSTTTGNMELINTGRIDAPTVIGSPGLVYQSEGDVTDLLINTGVINGAISLGKGDDTYFGATARAMDAGYLGLLSNIGAGGFVKISAYIDAGDGMDQLRGSKYMDYFSGGNDADTLVAGGGNDILIGGEGKDVLEGDAGKDTFQFNLVTESAGKKFDTITDFSHKQHDVINLSSIDADPANTKVEDFTFIGTDEFSGKAGELRYQVFKDFTRIYANTDNDMQPEMVIQLTGKIHLVAGDFAL